MATMSLSSGMSGYATAFQNSALAKQKVWLELIKNRITQ